MIIIKCDICNVAVNNFAHWYNDEKPRNMYELKTVHDSNTNTYDGMIICHECIKKLYNKNESEV